MVCDRLKLRDPDGKGGLATWNATRPPFVEADAVQRAAYLASTVGAPLYVVHTSSEQALVAALRHRRDGPCRAFPPSRRMSAGGPDPSRTLVYPSWEIAPPGAASGPRTRADTDISSISEGVGKRPRSFKDFGAAAFGGVGVEKVFGVVELRSLSTDCRFLIAEVACACSSVARCAKARSPYLPPTRRPGWQDDGRWSGVMAAPHQIRTRVCGKRKRLSLGLTLKAWYQASMFRTTPLTRYFTGAWAFETICWRMESSVDLWRQL
jgi:hypothetical protein